MGIFRKSNKKKKNSKRKQNRAKTRRLYKGGSTFDAQFKRCYDANLIKVQTAIEEYSGKHQIDKANAEQFINEQLTDVRKQAARDLVENTIYITLDEVSSIIEQLIIKVYTEHKLNDKENIYFYVSTPSKSFYFMSVLALFYIRKHNYKEPIFTELTNELFDRIGDAPIIMLDDVAYSGSQISRMLGDIYYSRLIANKTIPNIVILLVALNDYSKATIELVPTKKTKSGTVLTTKPSPFSLVYLPDRLYAPLICKIGIERYFNLNVFFSVHTRSQPYISLYLDHKLADPVSTYKNALLYGPIIPSNYLVDNFVKDKLRAETATVFSITPYIHDSPSWTMIAKGLDDTVRANNNITKATNLETFLLNKLIETDILDVTQPPVVKINFKPFITGCLSGPSVLTNINDPEIQDTDYFYFMGQPDDVKSWSEGEPKLVRDNLIRISEKINSLACPVSWYKAGEFVMACSSEDA